MTVNLAKELIKRDILVVAGGCGNHGLKVTGLPNLDAIGVDTADLPVAVSALDEQSWAYSFDRSSARIGNEEGETPR